MVAAAATGGRARSSPFTTVVAVSATNLAALVHPTTNAARIQSTPMPASSPTAMQVGARLAQCQSMGVVVAAHTSSSER